MYKCAQGRVGKTKVRGQRPRLSKKVNELMALHPCKECGQQVSSAAKVCPHCGKPLARRSLDTKAGCAVILGVVVLGAIISTMVENNSADRGHNAVQGNGASAGKEPTTKRVPNTASRVSTSPTTTAGPTLEASREKAREEAVLDLQRIYDQQGLDVQVSEGTNGELILTSDLFKDIGSRDQAIDSLMRNTSVIDRMCALGFQELDVSYSKGFLSGDVTRRVGLPCPGVKDALQAKRDQFARGLQSDFQKQPGSDVRAVARGTTLVLTSGRLFNTNGARQTFLGMFIQDTETVSKLCGIGFERVRAANPSGEGRSIPLPCEP
jgi:hypothetical protein